jgi:NhaC family Na+:H+ antiporter
MTVYTLIVVVLAAVVCSFSLQKGLERITKWMMLALLSIMVVLAVYSCTLDGGMEGVKFYLLPDWKRFTEAGVVNVIVAAMNQSFFSLSLGIGAMAIFGSYLSKDRTLMGEAVNVGILDTFVAITAGMIVSGSLFGDKMSPFSDSTNMAAASAGTDVFDHVYSMLWTTIPAVIISAILYFVIGLKHAGNAMDMTAIENIRTTIAANFNITPIVLIIPILTIFMTIKKVPPIMALTISAIAGIAFAFIFQPQFTFKTIMDSLGSGFSINTEIADVNKLLSRGGMMNMMGAVCLTFLVLGMGQILQRIGVMDAVLGKLAAAVNTPRALVITTLGACLLTTMVCASQYVAIVLPGQVMQPAYTRLGVKKRVLSRTLEDGGTIFCFLLPWTTSGVYVPGVLGVPVLSYARYAFFCLACPILCVVYAITGFAIFKEEKPAVTE